MLLSSTEAEPEPATVLSIPGLAGLPGLVHGFSTLALGDMRRPAPGKPLLTPPRQRLAAVLGLDPCRVTVAGAVHGAEVARVDEPAGGLVGFDALVSDRPGLGLLATFADCYPILLYDPVRRALALAHAGWRGSEACIAGRALAALSNEYGSRPEDVVAGIGPGICAECYEVGENVAGRFKPAHRRAGTAGRSRLDLAAVNRDQLRAAGVPDYRIHVHGGCTRERPDLPSHRRCPDGVRFACIAAIR